MEYFHEGSPQSVIDEARAAELIDAMLSRQSLVAQPPSAVPIGGLRRVLLLPPDFTRSHSWAGELAVLLYRRLAASAHVEIMPAIGTHAPMTSADIDAMFPGIPRDRFLVHDWRRDLARLGEVPRDFVREVSNGKVDFAIPCEINRLLVEGRWDRIISIGQLVPHEVAGIANHSKNVFVGVGGQETINKSHYLGAVYGMERIMGRAYSPVRDVFDYMSEHFARDLPVSYLLTVRATDPPTANLVTRGLYAGDDDACFQRGARLSREVNVNLLDKPIQRAVVYLNPDVYKSAWLGNKAIYRMRMAMADGGELIILAPGLHRFGEDPRIDRLIRKYGYRGMERTMASVEANEDLRANLAAAAHLIHGSSEERFSIVYCTGRNGLTREEIESVGFRHADLETSLMQHSPDKLADGFNATRKGEEVFYVSNPALGLWGLRAQFR